MRDLAAALPLLVPLVGAAATIITWRVPRAQRAIAITACALMVPAGIGLVVAAARGAPATLQVGGFAAPFAISLVADPFGALMALIAAVIGLAGAIYTTAEVPADHARHHHWPLYLLLLMGVSGAFLTADLFNLYVWFEVMLVASFALLTLGGTRPQLRGGLVYVVLNLIGSTLFLIGVGLVYGSVKALDLGEVSARLAELRVARPGLVLAIEAVLLTGFGIKAAVFPLFFWLPASYATPPAAVSAVFSGLLTKVGVYALIRLGAGVLPSFDVVAAFLVAIAAATMLVGVLGALTQNHVRRILSIHIVSQIGYMVAGLAVAGVAGASPRQAIAAAIFYLVHNILVKANLFLIAGIVRRVRGTEQLARLGGVAHDHPALAGVFLVSALGLAGIPPLSGFWAKAFVIDAALDAGRWALAGVAALVGLLTLTSMVKIWNHVFAGERPDGAVDAPVSRGARLALYAPVFALAALTIAIGLVPGVLWGVADRAAAVLLGGAP